MSSSRLERQAERDAQEAAPDAPADPDSAAAATSPPPPSVASTFNLSSSATTLYTSVDSHTPPPVPSTPFPLLRLPPELRCRIYEHHLFSPRLRKLPRHIIVRSLATTTGRLPQSYSLVPNHGFARGVRAGLMSTCRQVHDEVAALLFGTQTFRLWAAHVEDHKPTVDRIPSTYRHLVRTVQAVFGPGWTEPGVRVGARMRGVLREYTGLRRCEVFVEVDPSHPVFEGFRISKGFYTDYAEELLGNVLACLPGLRKSGVVVFDAGGGVQREGKLMRRLMRVARELGVAIEFGPQKGWKMDEALIELLDRESDDEEEGEGEDEDEDDGEWEVDEDGYGDLDFGGDHGEP